jgi:hypothetical protein
MLSRPVHTAGMNELPDQVRAALQAALGDVVEEVVAAVAAQVPGYRRPLEGRFGEGVRRGVQVALGRFLAREQGEGPALPPADRDVYVDLGRGELLQGRSLEALLAAYRVGARVAFRRFATLALAAGLPAEGVVPLAEATFAHIDELSAASIEGWAGEQSRRAGRRDRLRAELLARLVAGDADEARTEQAAAEAGWAAPEEVVVVAVPAAHAEGLSVRLGPQALVGEHGEVAVALVPARAGGAALVRRLADRPAAVSPPTPLRSVPLGLRLAVQALRLPAAATTAVLVEDRLADLVLHRDPELLAELVRRRLAPLDAARAGSRDRLAETLLAWLGHRGARGAVAESLHVHPQTVAYRLGVLRELFGQALDDPLGRFELELALRATVPARVPDVGSRA